ncbi:LCP family protein [Streptomyces tsukubensis]|uniref:Transcriptional regulator n=2 Tax=Streptomyces TaxID=1883 RepID=A0A7G3UAV6_STRT9|nr:LCP family protein [Streptomyces tsukubensis]AZK96500.1 transcriptional regulator [Streptomyces tsukubensis]QKM67496.1 transcriptional regulator [Streptomyces tsukubensis NRRL18488]TAI43890.1 LytR family transcriptional regulator [Streptomyces tsukubensis]
MSEQSSGEGGTDATGSGRKPHPRRRRRATVVAAWAAAGLIAVGGGGLGYAYLSLNGNLRGIDINAQLNGKDRPPDIGNGSMDVLVLGSDSRSGANREYGHNGGGARSDTAMVVHVYKDHREASVVSIPRDTLVDRPACTAPDGKRIPAADGVMFNSAYEVGGPACAVDTVEQLSGIRMDHYVEVDFTGFKKLVDELGGVKITTTEPIRDTDSRLDLPAGTHTLDGEQALGLVRTRKSVGDGSDLGRIQLQQAFMKAFLAQVKDAGLLTDPGKLYGVADTATRAVTTDSGLASVPKLTGFVRSLAALDPADVRMVTMPVVYDPQNPNRVLPLEGASQQVWTALRHDRPVPASALTDSAGGKGSAGAVVRSTPAPVSGAGAGAG